MRSLGVIFLADVVGYSKMMSQDETGALNLIREFQKEIIRPTLSKYSGNMIKSLGDGWLIEFKSASNAVNCAMAWQSISKQQGKMSLRVGIHLGDVEHEEGPPPDVYGDTVNIAARLESIAENGEVAISASTYLCLDENQAKTFNNCGKQTLKNISTPVEVWSTGRLNIGSKGMTRENAKPLISIKPFVSTSEVVGGFCQDVTHDLEKYLNQKDWIDWVGKYGKDNLERFKKPTTDMLEGFIDKIVVSSVMGKDRNGKELQVGHSFKVHFSSPIVDDQIEYIDQKKKSKGYNVINGKRVKKTKTLYPSLGGRPKKKHI